MPAQKRHRPLKLWVRLGIGALIILFISVGIINIIEANDIETFEDVITVSYNADSMVDYKVYYKPNDFYQDEFYGKGNQFVSDIVDNIHFMFNYNFGISKRSIIDYDYTLTGRLIGNYEASSNNSTANNIFTKDYNFGGDKVTKENISGTAISKEIDFNYSEYDDVVTEYKQQLNIPITSFMELTYTVNVHAKVGEDDITEHSTTKVKIPLNQKAFNITEIAPAAIKKNIIQKAENEEVNYKQEYIGIALCVLGLLVFIIFFKKIFNIKPKNHFNTELTRILKSYGDVIIELVNSISEEGMDIVLVKGFNELLDLEEELRIPINFIETYPNYEGEFTIIHDKIIYKYILTNEE